MDWWQAGSVMGTVVLATTAVATFGWRVLRQETDKLRQESRVAHDKRSVRGITQLQVGLSAEIAQGRTEIGQLRDGPGESAGGDRGDPGRN